MPSDQQRERYKVRGRPYALWPYIVWDEVENRRVAHHMDRESAQRTAAQLNEKGHVDA
jgi:hypothetical protein